MGNPPFPARAGHTVCTNIIKYGSSDDRGLEETAIRTSANRSFVRAAFTWEEEPFVNPLKLAQDTFSSFCEQM